MKIKSSRRQNRKKSSDNPGVNIVFVDEKGKKLYQTPEDLVLLSEFGPPEAILNVYTSMLHKEKEKRKNLREKGLEKEDYEALLFTLHHDLEVNGIVACTSGETMRFFADKANDLYYTFIADESNPEDKEPLNIPYMSTFHPIDISREVCSLLMGLAIHLALQGDVMAKQFLLSRFRVLYPMEYKAIKKYHKVNKEFVENFRDEEHFERIDKVGCCMAAAYLMGKEIAPEVYYLIDHLKKFYKETSQEYGEAKEKIAQIIRGKEAEFPKELKEGSKKNKYIQNIVDNVIYPFSEDSDELGSIVVSYLQYPDTTYDITNTISVDTKNIVAMCHENALKQMKRFSSLDNETIIYAFLYVINMLCFAYDTELLKGCEVLHDVCFPETRYKQIGEIPGILKEDDTDEELSDEPIEEGENDGEDIEELKNRLKEEREKNKNLKIAYGEIRQALTKQEKENKKLTEELTEIKEYLRKLEDEMIQENTLDTTLPDISSMEEEIKKHTIVIVGGHDNWTDKLKERFPNMRFFKRETFDLKEKTFVGVEHMYIFSEHINHSTFYKFRDFAKEKGIPIDYIHSVNIEKNIMTMYKDVKGETS